MFQAPLQSVIPRRPLAHSVFALCALFLLVFALAPGAHADDVVDEYNVSGTLTITGTNACSPACTETLDFSFLIEDEYNPTASAPYALYIVAGSRRVESLGPLGQFSLNPNTLMIGGSGGFCGPLGEDCNYIPFEDQEGDEIDLHLPFTLSTAPIVPEIESADLAGCGSLQSTCIEDFFPNVGDFNYDFGEVDATVTLVSTPEPSSLSLTVIGFGIIVAFLYSLRRPSAPISNPHNRHM